MRNQPPRSAADRRASRAERLRTHALTGLMLIAALALSACTDTPADPEGRGNIRAVHAISDLGTVSFLIEGVGLQTPSFQTTTPFSTFDSLNYDFNFDYVSGVTGQTRRLASTSLDVRPDINYTLVLTGTATAPRVLTLSQPEAVFDAAGTVLEVWFGNLSRTAGDVDIYLGAPGFDPAAAAPLATTLSADGFSAISEIDSGEYQLVATVAGQPGSELMRSEPATLPPRDRVLINLFDSAGETTGDLVFVLAGETTGARLVADDALPQLQLVHAAPSAGNIDLYIGEPLTTPLFADAAPGFVSAVTDIPEADDLAQITIATTAAGNVGALLTNSLGVLADGSLSLLFYSGDQSSNTLQVQVVAASRRAIFDAARVGIYNAIQNTGVVDIFLVEPGQNFLDARPQINNATPSISAPQVSLPPRDYELYVVENQTNVVLLGPLPLTLAAGDVRQIVFLDTANPAEADVLVIDLLSP